LKLNHLKENVLMVIGIYGQIGVNVVDDVMEHVYVIVYVHHQHQNVVEIFVRNQTIHQNLT